MAVLSVGGLLLAVAHLTSRRVRPPPPWVRGGCVCVCVSATTMADHKPYVVLAWNYTALQVMQSMTRTDFAKAFFTCGCTTHM